MPRRVRKLWQRARKKEMGASKARERAVRPNREGKEIAEKQSEARRIFQNDAQVLHGLHKLEGKTGSRGQAHDLCLLLG